MATAIATIAIASFLFSGMSERCLSQVSVGAMIDAIDAAGFSQVDHLRFLRLDSTSRQLLARPSGAVECSNTSL